MVRKGVVGQAGSAHNYMQVNQSMINFMTFIKAYAMFHKKIVI